MDNLDAAHRSQAKIAEWTTRHDDDVKAAYLVDGHSLSEIADRLGLTLEAVRQRLIRQGVAMRSRGKARRD